MLPHERKNMLRRLWYRHNKEAVRLKNKKYREANKQVIAEKQKLIYQKEKKKRIIYQNKLRYADKERTIKLVNKFIKEYENNNYFKLELGKHYIIKKLE